MARMRKAKPREQPRRKVCFASGKSRHTKKSAMGAINHQKAAGMVAGTLYIYKCPHCRDYHLTRRAPRDTHDVSTSQPSGRATGVLLDRPCYGVEPAAYTVGD